MPNAHFEISVGTIISSIAASLVSKYGAGVTVHYQTATDLVFSVPSVSTKVWRLYVNSSSATNIIFYYGDSWTSGTTIVNQVKTLESYYYAPNSIHIVLGDTFILFNASFSGGDIKSALLLIAITINGVPIELSYLGVSPGVNSYAKVAISKNLSTGGTISLATLGSRFVGAGNTLYKMPIILVEGANGAAILKPDGSLDSIDGVVVASYDSGVTMTLMSNTLITTSSMYSDTSAMRMQTSLMCEW